MAKPFLVIAPGVTLFDNSGILLSGGAKVFTYQAGTTTKLATYPTQADAIALTNANTNPVVVASSGRFPTVWATQSVKLVTSPSTDTDPPTNSYWTLDNISSIAQTLTSVSKTTTYTVVANDRDKVFKSDASSGSFAINLLSASSAGDGYTVQFQKIDSSSNTISITPNGSDNINGVNSAVILYNQYDFVQLYSDGTQWIELDNFNVTKGSYTKFMGPESLFYTSGGTWTITRNAEGDYSNNKTAASETRTIAIDITDSINTNTSKGFKLASFDLIYFIGTVALNTHTVTLDKVSYANNAASTVASVTISGSLSVNTQANPYLTNITVTTPAFNNTSNSRYIIEVTLNAATTSVYKYYGTNLHFSRCDT